MISAEEFMGHILLILLISFSSYSDQTTLKSYGKSKKIFWKKLYSSNSNKTLYCARSFSNRNGLNIEHVFAAAWMKRASGCRGGNRNACRRTSPRFNLMEADLHNLYPTVTKVNSARGSLIFDEINGPLYSQNCPIEISRSSVEPADFAKGQVARSVLYMQYEYDFNLDKVTGAHGFEDMLIKWHCTHPPTESELARNKQIFKIQRTNNPFILGEYDCSKVK